MRTLIAYASTLGSTREIAEVMAVALSEAGPDVDLRAVDDVGSLAGYQAVVLGSPVYNGQWLPEVHDFGKEHRKDLAGRAVWLFSVGAVGATSSAYGPRSSATLRRLRREPTTVLELRQNFEPRGHHAFAGVLDRKDWGRVSSLTFRLFGGHWGDHRDWEDIRAWATSIGTDLAATPPSSSTGD